jgi:hypothetical protein
LHLIADATYKILIEGFIVLTLGTSDKNGRFHPFGYGISRGEAEDDFKFLFDSLQKGISIVEPTRIYNPTCLIADNAEAISNGFQACTDKYIMLLFVYVFLINVIHSLAFGKLEKRVNCWAHAIRLMDPS